MWVERVRLRDPDGAERSVTLGRGLGVVLGGSESGKTRLATVLYGALFGPGLGPRGDLSSPLPGGAAWAEVIFHVGARRCVLRRDFTRGSVHLGEARAEPGSAETVLFKGTGSDPGHEASWRRSLQGLLGVADGGSWTDSGFVLQGDLSPRPGAFSRAGGEGGAEAAQQTLRALEMELRALVEGSGPGHPGAQDEIKAELEQRRREAAQWEERAAELWGLEGERERLETERERAICDAAEQEAVLENLTRFEELTRDRARLEESLQQLRSEQNRIRKQVEAVEAGEARLEADFADFLDAPGDLDECLQVWSESAARLRDVEMDLARVEDAIASVPRSRVRRAGIIVAAAICALAWLAFLGAGYMKAGFLAAPLLAAGAYATVWYLDRNAQRLRLRHEQDLVRLGAEREETAKRERQARNGLGRLNRYTEPSALRTAYRRYLDARGALDRARTARDSHRPLREVVDAYEQVFAELQILDTQTRDLVARARYLSGLDANAQVLAVEMTRARERGEAARAKVEWAAEALADVQGDIARIELDVPAPGWLAEDLARLEAREKEISDRAEAARLAVETLRACGREFQDNFLDRLAERASAHLARLTDGRMTGIRFRDADRLEARSSGGAWTEEPQLSGMARNALHLAMRIAVAEGTVGDRALPLILDEPFAAWDSERLAAAQAALAAVAAGGRQVVVLSSDERLSAWGVTWERLDPAAGRADADRRAA